MSRGGSYGGGPSSLGYLFGSEEPQTPPPAAKPVLPPYGIDITTIDDYQKPSSDHQTPTNSNNYPRADGQNSGNFLTDRPTTKVKSVPGGDSSLGYLFGDK
ncbi:protein SPIRAL1-like 5 [Argentina anserina]|uniref:protein SPIRAL1-like 5 n=1 Tax=Argentina anserina TaxID=57926 RepID=UPI00217646EC|nr:protein SPIRAL1-like 5 [Potentilla anserina]